MNSAPLFRKLALIGFGLIGGSIARGAKALGLAGAIVATARSPQTRAREQEVGIVDRVVETNPESRRRSRRIWRRARSSRTSDRSRARC